MTDRDGGFFLCQKVFNGHLPSFSGKYLPRLSLADKSVRNDQRGGSFLHHQQRSACLEQRGFLPDPTKLVVHTAKKKGGPLAEMVDQGITVSFAGA